MFCGSFIVFMQVSRKRLENAEAVEMLLIWLQCETHCVSSVTKIAAAAVQFESMYMTVNTYQQCPERSPQRRAVHSVVPEVEREGKGKGKGEGRPLTRQPCLGLGCKNQPLGK